MNLAFTALLLLLFMSPGVIAVGIFSKISWGKIDDKFFFSKNFLWALLIAIALHLLVGVACSRVPCSGGSICYRDVVKLLAGDNDPLEQIDNVIVLRFCVYFVIVWVAAAFLGWGAHAILISWLHLDHRYRSFRYNNPWRYLLSGQQVLLKDKWPDETTRLPDSVYVTVAISHASGTYLYRGFLEEFLFAPSGDIKNLVLSSARRRPLEKDRKEGEDHDAIKGKDFYDIVGHYLVIEYEDVVSLNIQYLWLDEMGPGDGEM